MTSVFYDLKNKTSVEADVIGKCSYDTSSGKRYCFKGLTEEGNKLSKFVSRAEYFAAKVKIIRKK